MNGYSDILTDFIFIGLHFFLFIINYNLFNKKIYQPAILFSLVWLVVLVLHFIFRFTILDELYPLRISAYLIFLIGIIIFSLGAFIINIQNKPTSIVTAVTPLDINIILRLVLTGIILVGLPLYIQAAFRLFIASQAEDFFEGLRYELSYGDTDIGPTKYLLTLSFIVFSINLFSYITNKNKVNQILLIACFVITGTYAFFGTMRTFFFMLLTLYVGLNFLYNKRFSIKKYFGLVVLFILLFIGYGILFNKGGSADNSLSDNVKTSTEMLGVYIVTPLNAFDVENKNLHEPNNTGDNSLRFFVKIAQQLNLAPNRKVSELIQEFVYVPYRTNVYTYYSPYNKDFGLAYAFGVLFFIGILHTWVCNKAVYLRTFRYSFYYSALLYPLLMTFFSDQYLSLFSSWIQMVVFVEMVLFANNFFPKKDGI